MTTTYLSEPRRPAAAAPQAAFAIGAALAGWLHRNAAGVIRWPWRADMMAASIPARVVARDMGAYIAIPNDTVTAILRTGGTGGRALAAWAGADSARPRMMPLAPGYPPVRCVLIPAALLAPLP